MSDEGPEGGSAGRGSTEIALPGGATVPLARFPNDVMRYVLGGKLTAGDKECMAAYFGVTVREVQRWTSRAGQQRNFIPLVWEDKPIDTVPEEVFERLVWISMAVGVIDRNVESEIPEESFEEEFATICDALSYVWDVLHGSVDPWLNAAWRDMLIVREEDRWVVLVTYERVPSPELK